MGGEVCRLYRWCAFYLLLDDRLDDRLDDHHRLRFWLFICFQYRHDGGRYVSLLLHRKTEGDGTWWNPENSRVGTVSGEAALTWWAVKERTCCRRGSLISGQRSNTLLSGAAGSCSSTLYDWGLVLWQHFTKPSHTLGYFHTYRGTPQDVVVMVEYGDWYLLAEKYNFIGNRFLSDRVSDTSNTQCLPPVGVFDQSKVRVWCSREVVYTCTKSGFL